MTPRTTASHPDRRHGTEPAHDDSRPADQGSTPSNAAPTPTDASGTIQRGTPDDPLDLLCVGVGPFGLGLACLTDPLPDVRAAFLDAAPGFDWHPGLLFDDATLQVPFLADLVTSIR